MTEHCLNESIAIKSCKQGVSILTIAKEADGGGAGVLSHAQRESMLGLAVQARFAAPYFGGAEITN